MRHNREPQKVTLGDYNFYIHPFGAMKASNISGELIGFVSPMIVSLASLFGEDDKSVLDMSIEEAAPSIINAFRSINGDTVEKLLRTLLITNKNVAYDTDEDRKVDWLDETSADEIFVGQIENLYLLAWEVIKVNYKGFFSKVSNLFGSQEDISGAISRLMTTEHSTQTDSTNSN